MSCKCYANKGESSMSFSYNPTCGKVNEGFLYGCSSQSCRNGKGCSKTEPPDDFIGAVSSYIANQMAVSTDGPLLYIIIVFMVIATTILSMTGA